MIYFNVSWLKKKKKKGGGFLTRCWGLKSYNTKTQNITEGGSHIKGLSSP